MAQRYGEGSEGRERQSWCSERTESVNTLVWAFVILVDLFENKDFAESYFLPSRSTRPCVINGFSSFMIPANVLNFSSAASSAPCG